MNLETGNPGKDPRGYMRPKHRELCAKCGRNFKDLQAHQARERSAALQEGKL